MDIPPGTGGSPPSGKNPFEIPEPSSDPALNAPCLDSQSQIVATNELRAFSTDEGWNRRAAKLEWTLRRKQKIILFVFVLGINIYWSYEVKKILWESGRISGWFHLNDSVLIALVSTSIANFLGLVVIVARHLFPADSSN